MERADNGTLDAEYAPLNQFRNQTYLNEGL
jgi:hypothetical protein